VLHGPGLFEVFIFLRSPACYWVVLAMASQQSPSHGTAMTLPVQENCLSSVWGLLLRSCPLCDCAQVSGVFFSFVPSGA